MEVGDVIKPNDRLEVVLPLLIEQSKTAQSAFRLAAHMVKEADRQLFEKIRECHPELEDYEFTVRYDQRDIVIWSVGRWVDIMDNKSRVSREKI